MLVNASRLLKHFVATFVVCVSTVMCFETIAQQESCQVAQLHCHARSGCQRALNNFLVHCQSVISGDEIEVCPTDCRHALVSLLSTDDETGVAFLNCNCNHKGFCVERKKRVEICKREVLESMHVLREDAPPVSCNLARWICEADTSCLAALRYYHGLCSKLFKGLKCTARCKNSLDILSRQPHASKLRSCLCDGTEEYDCPSLKVNTELMCVRRRGKHKSRTVSQRSKSRHQHSGFPASPHRKQASGDLANKRSRRKRRRNKARRTLTAGSQRLRKGSSKHGHTRGVRVRRDWKRRKTREIED